MGIAVFAKDTLGMSIKQPLGYMTPMSSAVMKYLVSYAKLKNFACRNYPLCSKHVVLDVYQMTQVVKKKWTEQCAFRMAYLATLTSWIIVVTIETVQEMGVILACCI